jgi:glycine betaine/choline ABC-type transport system substrate-binding protein
MALASTLLAVVILALATGRARASSPGFPITLTGIAPSSDVVVVSGGTCTEGTILAPSQKCTIELQMTPSSEGENSGSVDITSDAADSDLTVPISTDGN